ncbi:WD40 repeat domain-containing serine/threonine protein kinase [Nocardia cyriacigeorgica]|uniref:WD40 repeat domain-containing serine/threonine protein kinase n=1 Tax=Nocardia cyriacigeorgica TaxID=135487 RepID=UPI00245439D4|nr:serine/threonine-protein kinase [Nocardia cyriacigeorgica]
MSSTPETVIAGYRIDRVLGSGGMGTVYLARHPRMDRLVALKVLPDHGADPRTATGFEREVDLAARLDHPNIVPVYDRSAPGATPMWVAMKFIEGQDAAALLRTNGPLSAARAVALLSDIADGLDYAHHAGVLHRDVKPANILIEHATGRALLTDFGIARTVDHTVTRSGLLMTLAYTAPERFRGEQIDHRADVYALGCTLYELIIGTPPFTRSDQAAVVAAHLTAQPPRPSELRPDIPAGFDEVIAVALAKDPSLRYDSCGELAAAAELELAESDDRTTELVDLPPMAARNVSRRRLLAGAAIAVPAIAVAATAATLALRSEDEASGAGPTHTPDPQRPLATEITDLPAGSTPDAVVFSSNSGKVAGGRNIWNAQARRAIREISRGQVIRAFDPTGTIVAVEDRHDLRLVRAETGETIGPPFTGHTDMIVTAAFHPDGGRLVSGSWDKTIRIWDVSTGQQIGPALTDHGDYVDAVAISPNGTTLASAGWDATIRLWDIDTGAPIGPPLTGDQACHAVAFGPDGTTLVSGDSTVRFWNVERHIELPSGNLIEPIAAAGVESVAASPDGALFASAHADGTVRLWDARTRKSLEQPLTVSSGRALSVAFSPDGTLLAAGAEDNTIRLWELGPHR